MKENTALFLPTPTGPLDRRGCLCRCCRDVRGVVFSPPTPVPGRDTHYFPRVVRSPPSVILAHGTTTTLSQHPVAADECEETGEKKRVKKLAVYILRERDTRPPTHTDTHIHAKTHRRIGKLIHILANTHSYNHAHTRITRHAKTLHRYTQESTYISYIR